MIERPTTTEVMEIFTKAAEKAEGMQKEVVNAKQTMEKKLAILNAQYEYTLSLAQALKENKGQAPGKVVMSTVEKVGEYDSYGETIHKKLTKDPRDIFNMKTTRGYLPKGNIASVKVNNKESEAIAEALKHESVEGREFAIEEFTTNALTITIEPNLKAPLGSLKMNMIEICPFLPGSFNIESLEIYSKDNLDYAAQALPNGIAEVGSRRIIFDDKVEVGKIVIKVKLLYKNSSGKYLFGLQHLYVQEANFKENSYVIVKVSKADYISYLYDRAALKNQNGAGMVSSKEYGIRYYTEYTGEALRHEIEPSASGEPNYVSINTTTCFVEIPIESPIISFTPAIVTVKEDKYEP